MQTIPTGPSLGPNGLTLGPDRCIWAPMAPHGPSLGPPWAHHGPKLGPPCAHDGPKMDRSRRELSGYPQTILNSVLVVAQNGNLPICWPPAVKYGSIVGPFLFFVFAALTCSKTIIVVAYLTGLYKNICCYTVSDTVMPEML